MYDDVPTNNSQRNQGKFALFQQINGLNYKTEYCFCGFHKMIFTSL